MPGKSINKHYTSTIDKVLAKFNATHSPSASQQAEIEKYQRIHRLRDEATTEARPSSLWDFENQE